MKKPGYFFLHVLTARRFALALALWAALGTPAQSHGQDKSLKLVLDPAQTDIRWKLNGLHATHGTFRLKSGEVVYSPKTGMAEGEILVDAATGNSGNATRDRHMQDEVLESNRYPAIFFHPTAIKGSFQPDDSPQQLVGEGMFNIHGADHPLQLPLTVKVVQGSVTVTTHFMVPYVDWGMKNPSWFLFKVNKKVEIEVTAKGSLAPAE